MKRKILLLILIAGLLACACGCWDYKEYENLAMVSAVGFDTGDTPRAITVTVEYLLPGGGSSSQATAGNSKSTVGSAVVKATGMSIDDALTKVQQAIGKKLFYGYMQEIILGENAARQVTEDIVSYIDRTPNIRTSAYIAVTPGKAEDVLNTVDSTVTEPSSKDMHNLIDQTLNTGSAYPVSIQTFEKNLAISGEEPTAPEITPEEKPESNSGSAGSSTSSHAGGTASASSGASEGSSESNDSAAGATVLSEQKKGYFKVSGVAVFRQAKLVGWLNASESVGLGYVTNQPLNNYEIVKTSSEQNVMSTLIFRVTNSKCSIKIQLANGNPTVEINAYVETDLRKYANNIRADSLTPEVVDMMEKGLANNVKTEIEAAVQKGQKEIKTDVFGIGFNFYRQYPEVWHSQYEKKWEQIFPTLQIRVNAAAKVIDTGTSIKKFKNK